MGRMIFYDETGNIERVCYRKGCYYKINGICSKSEIQKIGKKCRGCTDEKGERYWSDKKQY